MRGAVWRLRCLSRVPMAFVIKGTTTTHNTRKAKQMTTLDKILTGNLEADIQYAIERVSSLLPDGTVPTVIINASTRPGNCFVAMEVPGIDRLSFFGADTICEAAEGLAKRITDPELLNQKRKELQSKIAELQAELDSMPERTPKLVVDFKAAS